MNGVLGGFPETSEPDLRESRHAVWIFRGMKRPRVNVWRRFLNLVRRPQRAQQCQQLAAPAAPVSFSVPEDGPAKPERYGLGLRSWNWTSHGLCKCRGLACKLQALH